MRCRLCAVLTALCLATFLSSCGGGGDEATSDVIFAGQPNFGDIPVDVDVASVFAGAPPPAWTTLEYKEYVRMPDGIEYHSGRREVRRLISHEGGLSRVETKYYFTGPNGHERHRITDYGIYVSGLFNPVMSTQKHQTPKYHVGEKAVDIRNIEGALFPLSLNNEMVFDETRRVQALEGPLPRDGGDDVYSHRYRVEHNSWGYPGSTPPVDSDIFLVRVWETEPDGFVDAARVHYSPALGAAVLIRRRAVDGLISELRLEKWTMREGARAAFE